MRGNIVERSRESGGERRGLMGVLRTMLLLWLVCLSGMPCHAAKQDSAAGARIVVAVEPAPTFLAALGSAFGGAPSRGVDPSADFLLALTPMLREGPPTELLIASPVNRKCIEERLKRIERAEIWFLQPARHAPLEYGRTGRVFQGETSEILRELRSKCYPHPPTVILADRTRAEEAMLGCILATARRAPLYLVDRKQPLDTQMDADAASARRIECIGSESDWKALGLPGNGKRAYVSDPEQVLSLYTQTLGLEQAEHVVVVRVPDASLDRSAPAFWALAVPYALKHRAAIVLVKGGGDMEERISDALTKKHPKAKYVTIFGDEASLPLAQVPDPVVPPAPAPPENAKPAEAGADPAGAIEDQEDLPAPKGDRSAAENTAPSGIVVEARPSRMIGIDLLNGVRSGQPCRYRVGRITGDSLATASLLAAGDGLSTRPASGSHAWMMANVGGRLPMLECIARATEQELCARGWLVSSSYGNETPPLSLEHFLAADLVIYQGHTAELGHFSSFSQKSRALPPSIFVLQGCVSLRQGETLSLLQRGAAGVVGSSTNIHSASGAAFTKAFLDAIAEGRDAGTSLMIARNYMLALSVMKKSRGHQQTGPPLRAALSFSLWGDPTWKPPCAPDAPPLADRVHAVRRDNRLELHVPATFREDVRAASYHAVSPVGGKLSGVFALSAEPEAEKRLVPQYFAVVPIEDWNRREAPMLSSKLSESRWISLWDSHNRWLYLLVWGRAISEQDRGKTFSFEIR